MKKLLSLLIVCVFAFTLLTGCGNGAQNSPSPTAQPTPDNSQQDNQPAALSGNISTSGSTSVEKVINALIEAFCAEHSAVTITYDAPGSGPGITAASEGTVDIGLASRALKDTETGLDATVFALDGIAIIVNKANPVSNLTIEQIAGLYTGEIDNWSGVGGSDGPVAIIGREPGSGTRDGFESLIGVAEKCLYDQEQTSTGAVISAVAANPNAIGYASLSAVNDTVKAVTVNGIACTEDTVLDGSYAVQRPFVFVTITGKELSPQAKAFVDFATSPDAAEIISNAGAVQPKT